MLSTLLLGAFAIPQALGAPLLVRDDDVGLSKVASIEGGVEHGISPEDNPCKVAWDRLTGTISADGLSGLPSLAGKKVFSGRTYH